jgi:hypothetical protein
MSPSAIRGRRRFSALVRRCTCLCVDPGGSPYIQIDGYIQTDALLIRGVQADDDDRELVQELFGLKINVTLVFVESSGGDNGILVQAMQDIMKASVLLAVVDGVRGVPIDDYNSESIILGIQDGRLTLNRDWDGWSLWPEVLSVIPQPHRLESMHGLE